MPSSRAKGLIENSNACVSMWSWFYILNFAMNRFDGPTEINT